MVPIDSGKLGIPGAKEHVVKLNAGHGGVCRFGTTQEDQDNFKLVGRNISDLYKKALQISKYNAVSRNTLLILSRH